MVSYRELVEAVAKGIEDSVKQSISDRGFEDGKNGRPPNITLSGPEMQSIYNRAYEMGQRFRENTTIIKTS